MRVKQLTTSDLSYLEQHSLQATAAAARALEVLLNTSVEVGDTVCAASSLTTAAHIVSEMSTDVTVVHVELIGSVGGQLMFVCNANAARALAHQLVDPLTSSGPERDAAYSDVLAEVGNIVLTSYINELVAATGVTAEPSPPATAHGAAAAILELPIARAASDSDVVVQVESMLLIPSEGSIPTRAPFHILFLPAPGSMSRLLHEAGVEHPFNTRVRVNVPMGELAVSRRPNHLLLAPSLGSCVAVALVDRLAKVAAVAHIMLPEAPRTAQRTAQRTYPARYADTAIPALITALERAGGRRVCAQVYLAGGGQMFQGTLSAGMNIPDRNVAAVEAALRTAGLTVHAADIGGTSGRSMEIDMHTFAVRVTRDGSQSARLDAA